MYTACLQNLTSLEVVFSSCYRRGLFSRDDPDLQSENTHALLPSWIQRCEKLTSLHLSFASTNTETIFLNSDAPNITQLRSVKLQNLAISEPSLRNLLTPKANTLSELQLEDIRLFQGSWASFYCCQYHSHVSWRWNRLENETIAMMNGYTRQLMENRFIACSRLWEARRFAMGFPSMMDEVTVGDATYLPGFSTIEN